MCVSGTMGLCLRGVVHGKERSLGAVLRVAKELERMEFEFQFAYLDVHDSRMKLNLGLVEDIMDIPPSPGFY